MPTDGPAKPKLKLRWYQFSLRTLLIFVTLFAVTCSWYAATIQKARRQEENRNTFYRLGYETQFDFDGEIFEGTYHPRKHPYPFWLENLFGMDYFYKVRAIGQPIQYWPAQKNDLTDVEMRRIEELTELRDLNISNSKITDTGLESLRSLNRLRILGLCGTCITDKGLECLDSMVDLEVLYLNNTQISDTCLKYLRHLKKLRILDVQGTDVTDAGVAELQKALPNCKIEH